MQLVRRNASGDLRDDLRRDGRRVFDGLAPRVVELDDEPVASRQIHGGHLMIGVHAGRHQLALVFRRHAKRPDEPALLLHVLKTFAIEPQATRIGARVPVPANRIHLDDLVALVVG